jgi:hypothetical protein
VAPEQRKENGVLQVLQPTQPVTDSNESVYIARVTAADPAHKPASIAEVEPVLRADVIKQQAYALAKADAEKLLAQAREKGLKEAAGGIGVVTAGPITSQSGEIIPGFPVSGTSAAKFTEQAFKLVSTPTSRPSGKPLKLIELAKDGRIVVAELGDLQAMWNERSRAMQEAQLHAVMGNELTQRFSRDWFDYDSVARRLSYVPNAAVHDQEAPTPPPQPVAPIF